MLPSKLLSRTHADSHTHIFPQASFDGLRACVPDLEPNDKSPKVAILMGATEHILKLKRRQQELMVSKDMLSTDNSRLHSRMRQLQAQLNALKM